MSKWIGYLPDFYAASPQIAALQGALEQQTEALWTAENGLIDQLDLTTKVPLQNTLPYTSQIQ